MSEELRTIEGAQKVINDLRAHNAMMASILKDIVKYWETPIPFSIGKDNAQARAKRRMDRENILEDISAALAALE